MGVVKTLTVANGLVQNATGGAVESGDLDAALQAAIALISTLLPTTGLSATDAAFVTSDDDLLLVYDASASANARLALSRLLALGFSFQARLTTESGVALSSSDRTSQSTLYLTPYMGNNVALYDGTRWVQFALSEIAIALSGLTSARPYDVWAFAGTATPSSTNTGTDVVTFGVAPGWATGSMVVPAATVGGLTAGTVYFYNAASSTTGSFHTTLANALAGTSKVNLTANVTQSLTAVSLELLSWTNDSTRATALATQNGVPVKSGDATRRLVGTIYTTATNATEDSNASRYVANVYNVVPRRLFRCPGYNNNAANTSYTISTTTFTEVNGGSPNGRVNFLTPLPGFVSNVFASVIVITSASAGANAGIGLDGTTDIKAMGQTNNVSYLQTFGLATGYNGAAVGKHSWVLCGYSQAGTATFFADGANTVGGGAADYPDTYLEGWVWS